MTDIWRSLVAQRILWENNWMLLFHSPTGVQARNEHNLMNDFENEIPGYLHNETIAETLMGARLKAGPATIGNSLMRSSERHARAGGDAGGRPQRSSERDPSGRLFRWDRPPREQRHNNWQPACEALSSAVRPRNGHPWSPRRSP